MIQDDDNDDDEVKYEKGTTVLYTRYHKESKVTVHNVVKKSLGDIKKTKQDAIRLYTINATSAKHYFMENCEWSPVARRYDPILAGSIDATDTDPHDHGIIRALCSAYKPNKGVEGDPECTVFVGRLNHATDENTLRNLFDRFGQIKRCRLVRDFITGYSRGYGFVEFTSRSDAKYAISKMNHALVDDKTIIVMFECERTLPGWIPRRLGGGFGGKKESGQLRFGGTERPFRKPIIIPSKTSENLKDMDKTLNIPQNSYCEKRDEQALKDRNNGKESKNLYSKVKQSHADHYHPQRRSTHHKDHRGESGYDRRYHHSRHKKRSRSRDSSGRRSYAHREKNFSSTPCERTQSQSHKDKFQKQTNDESNQRRRSRAEEKHKNNGKRSPKKCVRSQLSLSPE